MLEEFPDRLPKMVESLLKSWDRLRDEGEEDGVDWKDAKFVSVKFEIREQEGLKTTDIACVFSSDGKKYEFKIDDAALVNGRWLTLDHVDYRGRSRGGDSNGKSSSSRPYRRYSKSESSRYYIKTKTDKRYYPAKKTERRSRFGAKTE
jgi:hypothetical protein